jgi:hypothetical protein
MNLARLTLASATIALSLTACAGDDLPPDSGVAPADATTAADMGVAMLPEAGRPDAQARPDAGSMDAAVECIDNGTMTVDGTSVMVGPAGMHPVSRLGAQAVLTCRGRRPTLNIGAPVRASRPLYLATIVLTIFSPFTLVLPDQLSAHGHIMAMY